MRSLLILRKHTSHSSTTYSGCVEPPVTPVGRDELEMKRQRLYSELLRAAHAAVEHSVRFDTLGPEVYTYSNAMTTAAAAAASASVKTGDDEEGEKFLYVCSPISFPF